MSLCIECKYLDGVCTNPNSPIYDKDSSFLASIDPNNTPLENGRTMLGELERQDVRELQVCFESKPDTTG